MKNIFKKQFNSWPNPAAYNTAFIVCYDDIAQLLFLDNHKYFIGERKHACCDMYLAIDTSAHSNIIKIPKYKKVLFVDMVGCRPVIYSSAEILICYSNATIKKSSSGEIYFRLQSWHQRSCATLGRLKAVVEKK